MGAKENELTLSLDKVKRLTVWFANRNQSVNTPKRMKVNVWPILFLGLISLGVSAQTIAPDPEAWPGTINTGKTVHYVSVDNAFAPPSASWISGDLQILTGGDQVTSAISIGGHRGIVTIGRPSVPRLTQPITWATRI